MSDLFPNYDIDLEKGITKMRIDWYIVEKNEELILPWCIQYYQKLRDDGIDLRVHFYDNESTDGSLELLSKYPWIDVQLFKTTGLNDGVNQYIKNNAWKETKDEAAFTIVSDTDEVIIGDLRAAIEDAEKEDASILELPWFTLYNDSLPVFTEGKMLHEVTDKWVRHEGYGKHLIFSPKRIKEINYCPGAHLESPVPSDAKVFHSEKALILHFNRGFGAEYKADSYEKSFNNLSIDNRVHGWGSHYGWRRDIIINEYKEEQKKAIDLKKIIKKIE